GGGRRGLRWEVRGPGTPTSPSTGSPPAPTTSRRTARERGCAPGAAPCGLGDSVARLGGGQVKHVGVRGLPAVDVTRAFLGEGGKESFVRCVPVSPGGRVRRGRNELGEHREESVS